MDEIHLGHLQKVSVFQQICATQRLTPEQFAFIGDDVIDLPLMKLCGVSAAPVDAHAELLSRVDIVLDFSGGHGAVRQLIDLWLIATGQWDAALEDVWHGRI